MNQNNTDFFQVYADFLKSHLKVHKPIKIVCDCSNGTAGRVIEKLVTIPNLEIVAINNTPDPEFPAHGPNPLEPGAIDDASKKVLETGADFAVIYDADADRAFFVDNKGKVLPSYIIGTLLFKYNQPPFVCDEWVYQAVRHLKLFPEDQIIPSKIGTRYVKEHMSDSKASVGVEFSGHIYFKEFFGSDSGIFTTIQIINILSSLEMKLSAFRATLPPMTMINEDIKLESKPWAEIEKDVLNHFEQELETKETRDGLTLIFKDKWVSIRTSNTEPLLRLIAGADSEEKVYALLNDIKLLVR